MNNNNRVVSELEPLRDNYFYEPDFIEKCYCFIEVDDGRWRYVRTMSVFLSEK